MARVSSFLWNLPITYIYNIMVSYGESWNIIVFSRLFIKLRGTKDIVHIKSWVDIWDKVFRKLASLRLKPLWFLVAKHPIVIASIIHFLILNLPLVQLDTASYNIVHQTATHPPLWWVLHIIHMHPAIWHCLCRALWTKLSSLPMKNTLECMKISL